MQPLYTVKYKLSKQSFIDYTYKENQKSIEKGKRQFVVLSSFQMFVAIAFLIVMFLQNKMTFISIALGAGLFCLGCFSFLRLKKFDEKIIPTIEKNYFDRKYDQFDFKIDFYEEELEYFFEQQNGKLEYFDLIKVAKADNYLSLTFNNGQVIIFDKSCDYDKILSIVQKNLGVNVN